LHNVKVSQRDLALWLAGGRTDVTGPLAPQGQYFPAMGIASDGCEAG
jgi:hypothetical protein